MGKKRAKSEEPKKNVKSEEPKKKKPISLNILEIAKRLQKLEQTAGMPSEYPATQVMMSDGVTSAEDKLDEVTSDIDDISAITDKISFGGTRSGLETFPNGIFVSGTTFASYLADMKNTNKIRIFTFANMTNDDAIGDINSGICIAVGTANYAANAVYCLAFNGTKVATEAIAIS